MIRVRYNGEADKYFSNTSTLEANVVVTYVDSSSLSTPSPDYKYIDPTTKLELYASLNCFDYVPAIVPTNITHLTEEELKQWQIKSHLKLQ